ncbi:MAG: hypothetical protein A2Y59_05065 [Chloroflexi bacterium RBG_13_52_14]|nr:MAG: hypothetical protein A2Y59_05065 [Chloroflexi bacterium RBG_13_52_14]
MYSVKKQFRQLIRKHLKGKFYDNGFIYDEFDAPLGVVFRAKRIGDFFLSIAYVTRRWEDDLFTCEYCLSTVCSHNLVFRDLRFEHMARIGHLVTQEEREAIFPKRFTEKGVVDSWWQVKDQDAFINNITRNIDFVLECAERFDTHDRRRTVLASKELRDRKDLLEAIFRNATEQKNLSPIKDEKVLRSLKRHKGFIDIGESLQYLAEKQGLDISKDLFMDLVQDCYKMFYVQYPNPMV